MSHNEGWSEGGKVKSAAFQKALRGINYCWAREGRSRMDLWKDLATVRQGVDKGWQTNDKKCKRND
ncbi:MAG: hypothetical protein V2A61_08455 [Calditrichota bacterium]